MNALQTHIVGENQALNYLGKPNENLHFCVKSGGNLHYFLPVIDESDCKTNVVIELEGAHSSAESHVVFFGAKKQIQELRIEHIHKGRESVSQLTAKGAVRDEAQSRFYGLIRMETGSIGAQGILKEHSLLLSSGARIETIPALEIQHDQVEATHAATLEKVDAEKLFYMLSRGLSEVEAMQLLVEGFFKEALDLLPLEQREDLLCAILKKL